MQASDEQCAPTVIVQTISNTDRKTRRISEGEHINRSKMKKKAKEDNQKPSLTKSLR